MTVNKIGCFRGKENDRTKKVVKLANTLHRYATQYPFPFCPILKKRHRHRLQPPRAKAMA